MENAAQSLPEPVRAALQSRVALIEALPGVTAVYLYGSYAKGTQNDESDVDLAVFFAEDRMDLLAEYRELARICASTEIEFSVQVFSDTELADPCGIVQEIVEFGYPIWSSRRA